MTVFWHSFLTLANASSEFTSWHCFLGCVFAFIFIWRELAVGEAGRLSTNSYGLVPAKETGFLAFINKLQYCCWTRKLSIRISATGSLESTLVFSLSFPHPESVPQSWFFLVASAVLSIITQLAQTYFGKSLVCRYIMGIMCFHTEVLWLVFSGSQLHVNHIETTVSHTAGGLSLGIMWSCNKSWSREMCQGVASSGVWSCQPWQVWLPRTDTSYSIVWHSTLSDRSKWRNPTMQTFCGSQRLVSWLEQKYSTSYKTQKGLIKRLDDPSQTSQSGSWFCICLAESPRRQTGSVILRETLDHSASVSLSITAIK